MGLTNSQPYDIIDLSKEIKGDKKNENRNLLRNGKDSKR